MLGRRWHVLPDRPGAIPSDHADAMVAALAGSRSTTRPTCSSPPAPPAGPSPSPFRTGRLTRSSPPWSTCSGSRPPTASSSSPRSAGTPASRSCCRRWPRVRAVVFDGDAHSGSSARASSALVERERVTVLDLPTAVWHELVLHLDEAGEQLPESRAAGRHRRRGRRPDPARGLARPAGCRRSPAAQHLRRHRDRADHPRRRPARAARGPRPTGAPIGRPLGARPSSASARTASCSSAGPNLADGYPGVPEATRPSGSSTSTACRLFRTGDRRPAGRGRARPPRRPARRPGQGARRPGRPGRGRGAPAAAPGCRRGRRHRRTVSRAHGPGGVRRPSRPAARRRHRPGRRDPGVPARPGRPATCGPTRITVVPDLARTRSGKVDRRATHDRYHSPTRDPARPGGHADELHHDPTGAPAIRDDLLPRARGRRRHRRHRASSTPAATRCSPPAC